MKALGIVAVIAFFMLSACLISNREGVNVVRKPSPPVYVSVSAAPEVKPQRYSSGQVHFIAYGQVLSYWASQIK